LKIELVNRPALSNLVVASARTCYNSKIYDVDEVSSWSKKDELLEDLFNSGHHTTFMHSDLILKISGMSRLLIWRLLHAHTHYNSDQVSQRYVEINSDSIINSSSKTSNDSEIEELAFISYNRLIDILGSAYKEDARYILPQSIKANLYHTINIITALRYINACSILDIAKEEALEFAKQLEDIILDLDPSFKPIIEKAKNYKTILPNNDFSRHPNFIKDSDRVLVYSISNNDYMRNSEENHYYPLNMNSLLHSSLGLDTFLVKMKISLAGDSQNQRHRLSYGMRPLLLDSFKNDKRDVVDKYYIPHSIKNSKEAYAIYIDTITLIDDYCKDNIDSDYISYLIPNAYLISIIERNDFENFIHKSHMRLCLNAQDEILKLHYEIVRQLDSHGVDTRLFKPICVGRKNHNIRSFCTEGDRYCGVRMWKDDIYNKTVSSILNNL
jgi:thymidylate synthase ThyX